MRNASGHNYWNSSFIIDVAMGQIPRSTERISSLIIKTTMTLFVDAHSLPVCVRVCRLRSNVSLKPLPQSVQRYLLMSLWHLTCRLNMRCWGNVLPQTLQRNWLSAVCSPVNIAENPTITTFSFGFQQATATCDYKDTTIRQRNRWRNWWSKKLQEKSTRDV